MALRRVWMPSPNYREVRRGSPRLLVLHTTEGAKTIQSLGNFFSNPAAEASSHGGADDTPKTIGVYVQRDDVAWTQADFNDESIALEICAFARWPTSEWDKHPVMLDNIARWLAEEAEHFGIPLRRLSPDQAQSNGMGVCEHVDLGPRGGGHHDCGTGFPIDRVIAAARGETEPRTTTWYFLQDITAVRLARGQRMYYGGWEDLRTRNGYREDLEKGFQHTFRPFVDRDFDAPYFLDNSAFVKEIYGGWKSEAGRDAKRKELEAKLGRPLRPFSEQRTAAQGGVPWGCKKLTAP